MSRLSRVKVTEEVERAIREMARAVKSIAEIARVVEVSRPTVYAVLTRSKNDGPTTITRSKAG